MARSAGTIDKGKIEEHILKGDRKPVGKRVMRDLFGAALVVLVLCLNLAAPVVAGPFEDGLSAAQSGDYATAMRLWRPLADQGDVVAQFNIGIAFLNGYGVPKDSAEAETWFRKAANQGYAAAQNSLGNMYQAKNAADAAQNPRRTAEAASWYSKAANQGLAIAQLSLGLMYEGGIGVPQDYVQAYKWEGLAAAQLTDAEVRDEALKNRNAIAAKMTAGQLADAQRLVREWKPK
jgi:TPR repeat protein